ncbi:MAG: HK97 family phage prohead protease, partial [Lachnospiraceae bacterium]|nr:HK97 family phage prohead protease [Lachnospiraceae bacterium]
MKMAIKSDREYRMVPYRPDLQWRAAGDEEHPFIVEGYATTYSDPYTLFEYDGIAYKESVSRDALAGADMSDVIFLYNHEGMVYARQSNGTLELESDDRGLHIRADLSSTEDSRRMY